MPIRNPNGPTEFGGRQQRNTIQPPVTPAGTPGHTKERLAPDELLKLQYLTGQTDDTTLPPDVEGVVMTGLLPLAEAAEQAPVPPKYLTD